MNARRVVPIAVVCGVTFVCGFVVLTAARAEQGFDDVPFPAVTASTDPTVIERGRYLVHGPAACAACHVTGAQARDPKPGDEPALVGGLEFEMPGFGIVRTPNLTPDEETGIGAWTDGELARMIRYGVDRHGDASLEMSFVGGDTSDEDLTAIISYLRASEPVRSRVARSEHSPVYTAMVAWIFDPLAMRSTVSATSPPPGRTLERGEYLANGPANCVGCHSAFDPTSFALSRKFGGAEPTPDIYDPTMEFAAPNITSGGRLMSWTEEAFVQRFRAGKLIPASGMPWGPFSNISDDDLVAIYRYLKSLPAIDYDPGPSHRPLGWKPKNG